MLVLQCDHCPLGERSPAQAGVAKCQCPLLVLSGRLVFEERWPLFLPISLPGKRDLQPFPAESGKGSGSILVIQAHQHSVLKPFLRSRSDFPIPFHHSA